MTAPDAGTAFVLSGGGSIGAVQVGMLHALYERGVAADFITASSVGALNGAFVASRAQTVESARALADVWMRLRTRDVFPFSPVTGVLGLLGARDHLVSPRRLRTLINRFLEFELLERSPTPLHLIATDLRDGTELRLSSGSVDTAALASTALPGVFPPVRAGDRDLVDGGVTNNTPLTHAVDLGAARIYVLPTGYACTLSRSPRGAIGVATQALTVLVQQRLVRDIARVPEEVTLVVLPPLCPLDVSPIDFSRSAELIERSRHFSREFLDGLDAVSGHIVPEQMRTATHQHRGR